MFKGRYNGHRIMQTVINCGILVCVTSIQNRHAELDSASTFNSNKRSRIKSGMTVCFTLKTVLRIVFILLSLYGIYAFITRGIWRYMILQQQFFFFDFERGYALFALDYISIIILLATVIHYLNKLLQKGKSK